MKNEKNSKINEFSITFDYYYKSQNSRRFVLFLENFDLFSSRRDFSK